MGEKGRGKDGRKNGRRPCPEVPGIVIADRRDCGGEDRPRISAFIWGGKVRPTPTLPFGRWKGAA